jgi:dTDP-4-amino-4,6-dideoxygalactose transaminase
MIRMKIEFAPPYITDDEIEAVSKVLRSRWLSMGQITNEFEERFSEYIGSEHAVALNSCTSALFLSLKVMNVGRGDEVILPSFTFAATANVVVHCGAKPVFADIDPKKFLIDPEDVEAKMTKKTKAIIVVHYAGQPAEMDKIMNIANKYGIKVIEDAAHAAGSAFENGKKVGGSGNLTCFSFYATKPMTTGEGGMITLNDISLSDRLKRLRLHGMDQDAWKRYLDDKYAKWYYEVTEPGYKFNISDINSALGIEQLRKLDSMNEKRRKVAESYNEHLKELDMVLPFIRQNVKSSYHLYPVLLGKFNREKFIVDMAKRGIGTSVHFIPLHTMPYYQEAWGYKRGDLPVTEDVFNRIVSLPVHPYLDEEKINYITDSIKDILGEGR